ncbi:MAG TPA: hypothetical protein VLK66_00430 [Longimicrobium sp.]|nr:hypothetical protein [Longimicrobium sp.]
MKFPRSLSVLSSTVRLFELLVGDVAYPLLPILAVLFVVTAFHFDLPFGIFYLPEWSFASIIFLGLAIRTRAKKAGGNGFDSWSALFLLIIIAAAMTLAAIEMDDHIGRHFDQANARYVTDVVLNSPRPATDTDWLQLQERVKSPPGADGAVLDQNFLRSLQMVLFCLSTICLFLTHLRAEDRGSKLAHEETVGTRGEPS